MSTAPGDLQERRAATAHSVGPLRRAVIDFAARAGATMRQRHDIALAVSEALTNVVSHAYPGEAAPGPVTVQVALERDTLKVVVADEGVGMPPPAARPAARLGLAFMARAADRLELSNTTPGTRVRMTFAIG